MTVLKIGRSQSMKEKYQVANIVIKVKEEWHFSLHAVCHSSFGLPHVQDLYSNSNCPSLSSPSTILNTHNGDLFSLI